MPKEEKVGTRRVIRERRSSADQIEQDGQGWPSLPSAPLQFLYAEKHPASWRVTALAPAPWAVRT